MEVSDYFNQIIFKDKIRLYLLAANSNALIKKKTLVVFPENIGTWLAIIGEKHGLSEQKDMQKAMNTLVYSNAFDFF